MFGPKRITATEFARGLSEVLNRVRYGGESFVVERGGLDVCEVRPASRVSALTGEDLVLLLRSLPSPGSDYLDETADVIARQPPAEDPRWDRKKKGRAR
jgi:hypothetical protein